MSDNSKNRNKEYAARAVVATSIAGIGAHMHSSVKKSERKGLKAPTAKTSQKVMIRSVRSLPELVSEKKANAFSRTYSHHTQRHGMSKKLARVGQKAANESDFSRAFKRGMGKGIRVSSPFALAATVMSPTKLGDATMDGKKYKYDTPKLPKLKR